MTISKRPRFEDVSEKNKTSRGEEKLHATTFFCESCMFCLL